MHPESPVQPTTRQDAALGRCWPRRPPSGYPPDPLVHCVAVEFVRIVTDGTPGWGSDMDERESGYDPAGGDLPDTLPFLILNVVPLGVGLLLGVWGLARWLWG